jgi:HEAT repeat protein
MDDPACTQWKRRHPRYPGVKKCVELLRRRNTRGSLVDIICGELRADAASHAAELIAAFEAESDERLRHILLGVIVEAKLLEALPVYVKNLKSSDEGLREWAEEGLRSLNTPEARKALWEAGQSS